MTSSQQSNDEVVRQFAQAVARFRVLVRQPADDDLDLARRLLVELTALLHLGAQLPYPEGEMGEDPPDPSLTREPMPSIESLAGKNLFTLIFDPINDPDDGPVANSFDDALRDVDQELGRGEDLLAVGLVDEALWQWRFGFDTHWGRHAAELVYPLWVICS